MQERDSIQRAEAHLIDGKAQSLLEQIQNTKVVDSDSFQTIALLLKRVKAQSKPLEERLERSVEAARASLKESRDLRDEALAKFEEAEKLAKDKLAQFVDAHSQYPDVEAVCFIERWVAEVVDPALVPSEYLVPDGKKIQGIADALKNQCRIPGVKVTRRWTVRVG